MKVRKNYVLYINPMLGTAYYGNNKFNIRISESTIGDIFDCTFNELKQNINILLRKGYTISKRNY